MAATPARPLAPGTAVGRYRLEDCRGWGGFAAVYRARDPAGDHVAVKVLHPDLGGSGEVLRRFDQEAQILNRLRDPHIVQVLDVGEQELGHPFIAMEWVSGPTLESIREQRGRLVLPEAVAIMRGLCAALGRAHREGIVHRDVKGDNVMLADASDLTRVKLLDFGVAKLLEQDGTRGITRTGVRLGTPGYMAPEQIMGLEMGAAVDIYALGVLLFELLTGGMPFTGAARVEVEEKALYAPVPRASERAGVPSALDAVFARSMAKEPRGRYGTAQELLDALERIASGVEPSSVSGGGGEGGDGGDAAALEAEEARELLVAGLYVAVVGEHTMSDEALDAADRVLEVMTEAAASAGLEQAVHDASSRVFARPLPSEPSARAAQCAALRAFARAQQAGLPAELAPCFCLVLHVSAARRRTVTLQGASPAGGVGLLMLDTWTAASNAAGLVETDAFAAELPPTASTEGPPPAGRRSRRRSAPRR